MELKDAQRQACLEFGYEFEKVFRRGRPSDDVIAAKQKMEKRIKELLKPGLLHTLPPEKQKEALAFKEPETVRPLKRVATPDTTPLHNCTFDIDLATVSMKVLEKSVPDFLKKRKLS